VYSSLKDKECRRSRDGFSKTVPGFAIETDPVVLTVSFRSVWGGFGKTAPTDAPTQRLSVHALRPGMNHPG